MASRYGLSSLRTAVATTRQGRPSIALSLRTLSSNVGSTFHPLDPLSAEEISLASAAVKDFAKVDQLRFVAVSLKEPATNKTEEVKRQAEVVALNKATGIASEFTLDILDGKSAAVVESKALPPGTQPMFSPDDCDLAEEIAKKSPELQAALKERYGITDMSRVACDPWSINFASDEDRAMTKHRSDGVPARLVQTFLYYRKYGTGLEDNHYAHPIDLVPVVDLNSETLVHIDGLDRNPPPSIPTDSVNYHRDLLKTNTYLQKVWRKDAAKALNVVQPDGPSFSVTGNFVEWQKWSFRLGFNYREGIVLHHLKFDGRSVAKRLSCVEMSVPYSENHKPFQRKCAFDVGDYGLGYCANSLELGCDCLGHIHYFDAVLADADGSPVTKKKAICMHEEDDGILWKHVEYR